MKKIFLVMKDPTKGGREDNWISMESDEFMRFLGTEEGNRRRENFARLKAAGEDDSIIFVECSQEKAREIKQENNHTDYLHRQEKESGFRAVSLDYPVDVGEESPVSLLEILGDEESDTEREAYVQLIMRELPSALEELNEAERALIAALYCGSGKASEIRYAEESGESRWSIRERHKSALRKLRLYYRRRKLL